MDKVTASGEYHKQLSMHFKSRFVGIYNHNMCKTEMSEYMTSCVLGNDIVASLSMKTLSDMREKVS